MSAASTPADSGTPAACPVCGRTAESHLTCPDCGWTLRSALRAGPVTPDARHEFDQRLSSAQCAWDTRFAAILSTKPDRYAALIRGGPPTAQQWKQAKTAAESAVRPTVSEQMLRDMLSAVLRAAPGPGKPQRTSTIVEIDPDGITTTEVSIDKHGSPQLSRTAGTKRWRALIPQLAAQQDELHFQLAGRIQNLDRQALDDALRRSAPRPHADEVLVICRPATWQLLATTADLILASRSFSADPVTRVADLGNGHRPPTALVCGGPVSDGTSGGALVSEVAASLPLLRSYNAILAKLDQRTGRLAIELTPLFKPGDVPGTTASLSLRKPPGDDGDTTLAVVVSGGERDELLTAVVVPPPRERRYQLKTVLDGPGRVRFTDPAGIVPDSRPWRETLASVPSEVTVPSGPVDLVCAIELGGPGKVVDKRRNLIQELLSLLESDYPDPDAVRISVIGCVDHVFDRGLEQTRVLRGAPLASLAQARRTLRNLRGVEIRNFEAAPLEELLSEAVAQLSGSRAEGRAARFLLVGGRPPHPWPQKWANACPAGIRWDSILGQLTGGCRARCVVVRDAIPSRPLLANVWRQLGDAALREMDDTNAWQIGEDLRLLTRSTQRIAIPLSD
jgi:hypothetical protein